MQISVTEESLVYGMIECWSVRIHQIGSWLYTWSPLGLGCQQKDNSELYFKIQVCTTVHTLL